MCRMGGGPIKGRWVSEGTISHLVTHLREIFAPWTQGTPSVEAVGAGLLGFCLQSPEVYVAGLLEQVKGSGIVNGHHLRCVPTPLGALEFKALSSRGAEKHEQLNPCRR